MGCQPNDDLRGNIAIIQWDLRDRVDSIPGPDFLILPKIILFKNDKIFVYRVSKTKITERDSQCFEFGYCQNDVPSLILTKANSINPNNFDTLDPDQKSDRISHELLYAVVDLKSEKFSLFSAGEIDEFTLNSISDLLAYTDTATIINSSDSSEIGWIRERLFNIAKRNYFPMEIIKTDTKP